MDSSKKKIIKKYFWWIFLVMWLVEVMVVGVYVCFFLFFCFFFNYLRPHSVSPAFVSSSFPGRNYHGPSSRDAAACGPAALCVPVHSISTVPRGRERATVHDGRIDGPQTKKKSTHEDG
jgi:hypothetical protein